MSSQLLADGLMVIHFLWVLFMVWGIVRTIDAAAAVMVCRRPPLRARRFLERWLFRTVHLAGILFTGVLAILGRYCPLTIWEYQLRRGGRPFAEPPESFLLVWVERLLYPDVPPALLETLSALAALFALAVYAVRPPAKVRQALSVLFRRLTNRQGSRARRP
ncbi:MAG TPA: DUF2784 domain-containing protein [Anaerohalosphaeraceae bacterium]|nr:DUF2784 domain-containing protein [Anaerohalosphaeraceae bacterium]